MRGGMEPLPHLPSESWHALGTTVVLRLGERGPLSRAREAVQAELTAIDRACSRFRSDSELCRLNAAAGRPVKLGPLLCEALQVALRAAQQTDGDVDPTLGASLEIAGYDRDWSLLVPDHQWSLPAPDRGSLPAPDRDWSLPAPDRDEAHASTPTIRARRASGWRAIFLDKDAGIVKVPAGIKLDLGATAKAWAADRAARAAAEAAEAGALVSLGGDIATAGAPPAEGWRVRVTDDHRSTPDAPGQTVRIRSGGLATSSIAVRRWIMPGGARMHHIIDPQTGTPVEGRWRTVSVAAATCLDANVAATAAIVRSRAARQWLAHLRLPARLIARDGTVLCVAGWPQDSLHRERPQELVLAHCQDEPGRHFADDRLQGSADR